jgi:N-acetyl-alpha-D-muramate 1-phosphate uridylyltransferase
MAVTPPGRGGVTIETAMVMAAGLGKRMRPLTATRPKPLIRIGGKALIDYALDRIEAAGIAKVVVNAHYLPDALEAHLRRSKRAFSVTMSDERAQLMETGGGLIQAQRAGLFSGDPILCANSDNIWTDGPYDTIGRMADAWDGEAMDALLLLVPHTRAVGHGGRGDFRMDGAGKLTRRKSGAIAPYIFSGVQLLSRGLLRDPPEGPFSTNILWDRAIEEGRLYGIAHEGSWCDVGTVAAIPKVEAVLAGG